MCVRVYVYHWPQHLSRSIYGYNHSRIATRVESLRQDRAPERPDPLLAVSTTLGRHRFSPEVTSEPRVSF